jgi:uncharacterized membrane protein
MTQDFNLTEYIDNFEVIYSESLFAKWWFISGSQAFFLISLYFLSRYMSKRSAFNLKYVAAAHNLLLTFISLITVLGFFKELKNVANQYMGEKSLFMHLMCRARGTKIVGGLYFWSWVYHITKVLFYL